LYVQDRRAYHCTVQQFAFLAFSNLIEVPGLLQALHKIEWFDQENLYTTFAINTKIKQSKATVQVLSK
jgi:hypothetical protein